MKLMASGVTFSAAIIRSPSFSRSSSSTMMTMRPSWTSTMASSILANCIGFQKILNVFCDDVELQVDGIAGLGGLEVGIFERVRNYCDGKDAPIQRRDGKTDTVNRNRAFLDNVARSRL